MHLPRPLLPRTLLALITVCVLPSVPLHAQVNVSATQQFNLQSGSGLKAVTGLGTFNAAGADKLVVVVTTEHGFNNGAGDVLTVKYNGITLTPAVESKVDRGTAEIWYLDNPGSIGSGTIEIDAANPNGGIGAAYALLGTLDGIGATGTNAGSAATSVDITTTADDSFVIAVIDNAGNNNSSGTPTANPPLTQVSSGFWGSQWGGHCSGYRTVPNPSTVTSSFTTNTGGGYSINLAAVEILAGVFNPDTTPPTLAPGDIVDDAAGGPVSVIDTVTYTVTYSEPMQAATVEVSDFENGGSPAANITSVTTTPDPAVFQVAVTPSGAGTLRLQVAAGAVLEDLSGNALGTTSPIADDTVLTVTDDQVPPTLAGSGIVDNLGGGPAYETQPVIFTFTFDEAMNAASVDPTDFENAGSPAATIHGVEATSDPAVFVVTVIPGGSGTLRLQVKAGAVLSDLAGNPLDTSAPIADDTTISITAGSPPAGTVPNQSYPANELFEIISPQLGTRHLNQPSVFNGYGFFAGNAVHEVYDFSNPYAPTLQSTMTSNHAAGEAESHQVTYGRDGAGNYYLATTSGRGIDIWNVTDALNPRYVKALELPGINYGDVAGGVWGLSWQGDYIYVGATSNGLYVVDARIPSRAEHVSTLPVSGLGGVWPGPLFALGELLVVTTPKNRAGIATVDISDPLNPVLLDAMNPGTGSYIGGFYGTHAWLITPLRGFDVTTDPSNITLTSTATVPASEYQSWADNHLFLGGLRGGTEGIWKYDASDPNNLVLVGRVQGRDSRWDDQFNCPAGNLLLIADDQRVGGYVGGLVAVHDTQPDTTALTVSYVNPPNGATGTSLNGQVGISFSEWVEFASVDPSSFILRKPGGAAIPGKWGCTYTTVSFSPDAPLEPNTTYEVVLPAGGVTDLPGNAIAATFTSTFTTGNAAVSPGSGVPGFAGPSDLAPAPPVPLGTVSNFSVLNPLARDTYNWDFGDGTSASGAAVSRTCGAPGRYPVQFEVVVGSQATMEAEDGQLSGVDAASSEPGYTGTGYGDYVGTGSNAKITWYYQSPVAGTVDLTFRYANGAGALPLNLYVNGGSPRFVNFTGTGAWSTWSDLVLADVPLQPGLNTLELVADAGGPGPHVDHVRIPTPGGGGQSNLFSFTHIVHNPLTAGTPSASRPLAFAGSSVWTVNPDTHTVSEVDRTTLAKLNEVAVGLRPKSIATAPDGTLWVSCADSWEIAVVDPSIPAVIDTIALPYASQPMGLAMAPDGSAAYVTLQALCRLVKLDPATRAVTASLDLALDPANPETRPKVRALAVNAASDTVLVTRHISPDTRGEVYEVDAATMSLTRTIALAKDPGPDSSQNSRGLPNYLNGIAISPDGTRAWVASKKDNIDRGGATDGLQLLHDVTVRAITSTINLAGGTEVLAERKDHDNNGRCESCTFSPLGDVVFVTLPDNNRVTAVDAYTRNEINTLPTGETPEGSVLDAGSGRLFVLNFMGRSLSVFDVSDILSGNTSFTPLAELPLVDVELLAPQVLTGKRLFYDASSQRINQSGYMSCATCHLDGSHDGRTYDFTSPMGEGLRATIDLRGRAGTGHGRVHWTGNFDEIHDFEGQLRLLGNGTGLMDDSDFLAGDRSDPLGDPKTGLSSDLDALSAYVATLDSFPPSPYRNPDGSLTADALAGRNLFNSLDCFECHGGGDFTDSALGALHDVGTLQASSGQRLGGPLTGLDTPTLRGIWASPPYLHDGSAATLRDVLTTANPGDLHGVTSSLTPTEVGQLAAYLRQLDGLEPAASPAIGIGAITYDSFASSHTLSGPLAGPGEDADGDGWANVAEMIFGGTDPTDAADRPRIHTSAEDSGGTHLHISWLQLDGGTWDGTTYRRGDIAYAPEGSLNLQDWSEAIDNAPVPAGLPPAPAGYKWAGTRLTVPIALGNHGFLRIQTSYTP